MAGTAPSRERERCCQPAVLLLAGILLAFLGVFAGSVGASTTAGCVYDRHEHLAQPHAVAPFSVPFANVEPRRASAGVEHGYDDRSPLVRSASRPSVGGLVPQTTDDFEYGGAALRGGSSTSVPPSWRTATTSTPIPAATSRRARSWMLSSSSTKTTR